MAKNAREFRGGFDEGQLIDVYGAQTVAGHITRTNGKKRGEVNVEWQRRLQMQQNQLCRKYEDAK
jgi:hypothetical protein